MEEHRKNLEEKNQNKLTNHDTMGYSKGKPVRCECGRVVAYERHGSIYVYCKGCKRQIAVLRAKSR